MPRLLPLLIAAFALPAAAQVGALEDVSGPSPAASLHGDRLRLAEAEDGSWVGLTWPEADSPDHLDFATTDRTLPRFGAAADAGLSLGIEVDGEQSWLWQDGWTHGGSSAPGSHRHEGLGVTVTTELAVGGDGAAFDVAVRHDLGAPVRLLLYANLQPAAGGGHDHVAFHVPGDGERDLFVQGRPTDPDLDALEAVLDATVQPWQPAAAQALDAEGAWFALAVPRPDAFQVGQRDDCGRDWNHRPTSAWQGTLDGSPVAGCDADLMLAWDLTGTTVGVRRALALGVSSTAAGAQLQALADSRAGTDGGTLALRLLQARTSDGLRVVAVNQHPDLAYDAPASWEPEIAAAWLGDPEPARTRRFAVARWQAGGGFDASPWPGSWPSRLPSGESELPLRTAGAVLAGWWWSAAQGPADAARLDLAGVLPQLRAAADLLSACVADDDPALSGSWQDLAASLGDGVPSIEGRDRTHGPCDEGHDPVATALSLRAGLLAAHRAAVLTCTEDEHSAWWKRRADELAVFAWQRGWDGATWSAGPELLWPDPLELGELAADAAEQASLDAALAVGAAQLLRQLDEVLDEGAARPATTLLAVVSWLARGNELPAAYAELPASLLQRLSLATTVGGLRGGSVVATQLMLEPRDGAGHLPETAAFVLADALLDGGAWPTAEPSPLCGTGEEPAWAEDPIDCAGCNNSVAGSGGVWLLLLLGLRRRR